MNTREKFKRRVTELIHGKPCEELPLHVNIESDGTIFYRYPITIGRVVQALGNPYAVSSMGHILACEDNGMYANSLILWKLIKENGKECTDDDQTDETIDKFFSLIK